MKEKNNTGLVILIVIFVMTTIGLGSFLVYDKVLNKETNSGNDNDSEPDVTNVEYNHNLSKRIGIQGDTERYYNVIVDTNGEAYLYTYYTAGENKIPKLEAQFKTYSPKGYDQYGVKSINSYKFDFTDVLSVQHISVGNAGGVFAFIRENGKISILYCDLLELGTIKVKDIDELTGVVAIVDDRYANMPYAILSDGKEVSLFEYIY